MTSRDSNPPTYCDRISPDTRKILNISEAIRVQASIARREFAKLLDIIEAQFINDTSEKTGDDSPVTTPGPDSPSPLTQQNNPSSTEDPVIVSSTSPNDSIFVGPAHALNEELLTDREILDSNLELATRMDRIVKTLDEKAIKKEVDEKQNRTTKGLIGIYGIWVLEFILVIFLIHSASVSHNASETATQVAKEAKARSECQSKFNKAQTDALSQRSIAAAKITTAQDNFLTKLSTAQTDSQKAIAFTEYKTILHDATIERDTHPIPTQTNC